MITIRTVPAKGAEFVGESEDIPLTVIAPNDSFEVVDATYLKNLNSSLQGMLLKAQNERSEFIQVIFAKESKIAELQAENDSLRTALTHRNAQYWELCDAVERLYKTIEGEKRKGIVLVDAAELDSTDCAHPAWWRGHDHTVKVMCEKINLILDGKDNGAGVSNEPWESTRRRMLNLASIEFLVAKREEGR